MRTDARLRQDISAHGKLSDSDQAGSDLAEAKTKPQCELTDSQYAGTRLSQTKQQADSQLPDGEQAKRSLAD